MDRSDDRSISPQSSATSDPPRVFAHASGQHLPKGVSPNDPMAMWLVALQHDLLGPTYGILNQIDALTIGAGDPSDRSSIHSVFSSARSLERNLRRVLDLAKLSAGALSPSPEVCSAQSLTHEAVLVARAIAPKLLNGEIRVQLPCLDVVSMLEKRILVELLATIVLLVYRAGTRGSCDLNLTFLGEGKSTRAVWHVSAEPGVFPGRSLDELQADPRWASRHLFDLAFVGRVAVALGGAVGVDPDRSGLILELPTVPVHKVDELKLPRNVLWTTAPILMSTASPEGFTPVPGNVIIVDPTADMETQIEETGARLFIAHHTREMRPEAVFRLLVTCVTMPIPVLLRSSALDYDTLCNFQDHVDAFLLEPCRRETLARYVVGLASNDRRTNRRAAQIHT